MAGIDQIGFRVKRAAARSLGVALSFALGFTLGSAVTGSARAQTPSLSKAAKTTAMRGQALLRKHCVKCHAVAESDASSHHLAPPFRTLGQRYPIDSLEEALAEGLVSGHPDMPEFTFAPGDVGAIIVYLKSIQVKP